MGRVRGKDVLCLGVAVRISSDALRYDASDEEVCRRRKTDDAQHNQPFPFAHLCASIQYF